MALMIDPFISGFTGTREGEGRQRECIPLHEIENRAMAIINVLLCVCISSFGVRGGVGGDVRQRTSGGRPALPPPIRTEAAPISRTGTRTYTVATTVTVEATAATRDTEDVATGAAAADGPAGRPITR
jgi:hypothetical protein